MAIPRDLIGNDILYEGANFAQWSRMILVIFINIENSDEYLDSAEAVRLARTAELLSDTFQPCKQTIQKLNIVKEATHKDFLSRIPEAIRCGDDPYAIITALKDIADKPFPLMQLPEELRLLIYEQVFAEPYTINLTSHSGSNDDNNAMRFVQTCPEFRHWMLPSFYESARFEIFVDGRCSLTEMHNRIRSWINDVVGENVEHLSYLCVEAEYFTMEVYYSDEEDLILDLTEAILENRCRQMLEDHLEGVNAYAAAANLRDEAIGLFFTMRPELWAAIDADTNWPED